MARGYPGAFGRKVNSPFVWIALTLLFIAPFVDPRRLAAHAPPRPRGPHGLRGQRGLLQRRQHRRLGPARLPADALPARRACCGSGCAAAGAATRCACSCRRRGWSSALLFLVGFRIGLNVADSNVIDVGYAGVIGADRLADGDKLCGDFPKDNEHGDTYGPVTYAAYVPFEQVLPWSGRWDDLPAAHAAADRLRPAVPGPALPHRPAHARPDARARARLRVGGEPVHALRAGLQRQRRARRRRSSSAPSPRRRRPAGRGALIALAGMAKFAPLALAPLFATHTRGRAALRRSAARAALVPCLLLVLGYGGPARRSTTARWASRPRAARRSRSGACTGGTRRRPSSRPRAVLLAVAVAFLPRRRDLVGLCALAAAVLIALQLGVTHWFYLYIVWFLGPLLIALLGDAEPAEQPEPPSYVEQLGAPTRARRRLALRTAVSPRRCAAVAASTRERTPSLARIRETWTLAVFSEMNSVSPISRLVCPSATSARTVSSRSVSPRRSTSGSSEAASGRRSRATTRARRRARRPRPPAAARAASRRSRRPRAARRPRPRGRRRRRSAPRPGASGRSRARTALPSAAKRSAAAAQRARGRAPLGARELRGAQRVEGGRLGARRAVVPALGRQQGAQALEHRARVALRLGRRAARRRARARAARGRRRRAGRSRAGAWCSGRTGPRGRSPARRWRAARRARDRPPRARSRPARAAWLPIHIESLVPPSSSRASSKCSTAASSLPRRIARWAALSLRTTAATPLGPSASTRSTMAAVSSRRPRRVSRQHASPCRNCA